MARPAEKLTPAEMLTLTCPLAACGTKENAAIDTSTEPQTICCDKRLLMPKTSPCLEAGQSSKCAHAPGCRNIWGAWLRLVFGHIPCIPSPSWAAKLVDWGCLTNILMGRS